MEKSHGRKMRILSVTGNRADYDLLSYLYKKLNRDPKIDFKLVVTGAHLTVGNEKNVDDMRKDGNEILACIENILNSDTLKSRPKSMATFMTSFIDIVAEYMPELILCVGDREEVPAVTLTAAYMKIPCAHFFGGDYISDGHIDNLARNVGSKLATVHFVTLEEHKKRLMAMGEEERRIFVTGSPALDKFREEPRIDPKTLLRSLGCEHFGSYALVIYHPPTDIFGENHEIRNILKVLAEKNICAFVSYPNTDFNNSSVIKEFTPYMNDKNFFFYRNLDRNTFINIYRNAEFHIGNSSAGIGESASIPLPVINVGSREKDRAAQENVLFIDGDHDSIASAVDLVRSAAFREKIAHIKNQYGDGHSSERIYRLLKQIDFTGLLLKTEDPLRR